MRDLVLSAFRAIQWPIQWPLFMDSTKVYLARRARVDVEALTEQSRVHLNEGRETNGGMSAVLLANAPRECYVRAVPCRIPDRQNLLPRDWLGRDIFLMLQSVLACFYSNVLKAQSLTWHTPVRSMILSELTIVRYARLKTPSSPVALSVAEPAIGGLMASNAPAGSGLPPRLPVI